MGVATQIKEQLGKVWTNLAVWQKRSVLFVVLLALIGLTFLVYLSSANAGLEPLYTNLDPIDAGAIAAKLKEQKIAYELTDEGRTILVSGKDKYQLRLDMAGQVSLKGTVGFESFNETRFGETDTDKRVRFLIALQGELTRTIEELAEVESAKVHIALPAPSLFIGEQNEPTASVLLRLKPYARIKPEQVKSVMAFVSNSVEGLKRNNVTIMDVNGNLLSEGLEESGTADLSRISSGQMALKQQCEQELARSVQSMLERMIGAGKVVVRTSLVMDFDQVERRSETLGDPTILSEHSKEESSSGTQDPPGGNPADVNMGQTSYGSVGSGSNSSHEISESIRNYEISKISETKTIAPGQITRLSIAVLIDGELNEEAQAKLVSAVSKAAGVNIARGDEVSIIAMPFNTEQTQKMEAEMTALQKSLRIREYVKYGLTGLGIIGLLGLLVFALKNIFKLPLGEVAFVRSGEQPAGTGRTENASSLSPELLERKNMRNQIDKIVQSNPEEAAKVIKTWLAEEQV